MDTDDRSSRSMSAVTWGPVTAILGTIAIYFGAQFVGELAVGLYVVLSGTTLDLLRNSVAAQFYFVLIVEITVVALLYWVLRRHRAGFGSLGFRQPRLKDAGYTLIGYAFYVMILLAALTVIDKFVPSIDLEQQQQLGFETAQTGLHLAMIFVSLVILPPIVEEILARGFLYLGLKKRLPRPWAVIITSLIFAVAHLQLGTGAPPLWAAAVDTFLLSLVLIYVRDATDGLWAPIGLHMIKNGMAFVALFVFPSLLP